MDSIHILGDFIIEKSFFDSQISLPDKHKQFKGVIMKKKLIKENVQGLLDYK